MAKPGPKPKPTVIRALDGDHHKSRYNLSEPQYAAFASDPPAWLLADPIAIECWWWAAPRLASVGVITDADTVALEVLCVAYSTWRERPSTNTTRTLLTMLAEFGLTPSSRTRLVGKMPHEGELDPIAARLSL